MPIIPPTFCPLGYHVSFVNPSSSDEAIAKRDGLQKKKIKEKEFGHVVSNESQEKWNDCWCVSSGEYVGRCTIAGRVACKTRPVGIHGYVENCETNEGWPKEYVTSSRGVSRHRVGPRTILEDGLPGSRQHLGESRALFHGRVPEGVRAGSRRRLGVTQEGRQVCCA